MESSRDGHNRDTDARYDYYKHGPLRRKEIGEDKLQGLDYVYTLQGWLKSINHASLQSTKDPGGDGLSAENGKFGGDVWGMQLNYYKNDFTRTNSPFGKSDPHHLTSDQHTGKTSRYLFNGNIASRSSHVKKNAGGSYEKLTGYRYHYDMLNRLTKGLFKEYGPSAQDYVSTGNALNTDFGYDPNGNPDTLTRYDQSGNLMDELSYNYHNGTNQLGHVDDGTGLTSHSTDIEDQSPGNYHHDEAGRLTSDDAEYIDTIMWNAYDKVEEIWRAGDTIQFMYDAAGNRVMKSVEHRVNTGTGASYLDTTVTYYGRDARGTTMGTYRRHRNGNIYRYNVRELLLYGRKRLGTYNLNRTVNTEYIEEPSIFTNLYNIKYNAQIRTIRLPWWWSKYSRNLGRKRYELTDHLGNVRATISDHKLSDTLANGTIDTTYADVASYQHFYPFGSLQPGRNFNPTDYRFGFQGKEQDSEINNDQNNYNFKWRQYESRLGRWWSTDALEYKYPAESPYSYGLDNPIYNVDREGNDVVGYVRDGKLHLHATYYATSEGNANFTQTEIDMYNNALKRFWSRAEGMEVTLSDGRTVEIGNVNVKIKPGGKEWETKNKAKNDMLEGNALNKRPQWYIKRSASKYTDAFTHNMMGSESKNKTILPLKEVLFYTPEQKEKRKDVMIDESGHIMGTNHPDQDDYGKSQEYIEEHFGRLERRLTPFPQLGPQDLQNIVESREATIIDMKIEPKNPGNIYDYVEPEKPDVPPEKPAAKDK